MMLPLLSAVVAKSTPLDEAKLPQARRRRLEGLKIDPKTSLGAEREHTRFLPKLSRLRAF
jgi:hypothetical protein